MGRIEDIELRRDLAGKEGMDSNHASRARIHVLLEQHSSLVAQTQFADAKTAGLVTLVGLLALKGPVAIVEGMVRDPVLLAAALLAAGCILFCLLAVFPRYPGTRIRAKLYASDRFSWPALSARDFDVDAYARFMQTVEVSQMIHSLARSNASIARILLRKYQMLRIAFLLGGANFLLVFTRLGGLA